MSRLEINTARIATDFGSHFVHVHHDQGRIVGVRISFPGKIDNTGVGRLLDAIGDAVHQEIKEIEERWG